eukprot:4506237-Prymnesium_polylepis.1
MSSPCPHADATRACPHFNFWARVPSRTCIAHTPQTMRMHTHGHTETPRPFPTRDGTVRVCADLCGRLVREAVFFCVHLSLTSLSLSLSRAQLWLGVILKQREYLTWLLLNVAIAVLGGAFMAAFYYLDWRRAPDASSLISAPRLDVHDKRTIGRAMMFAAAQARGRPNARV